MDSKIIFLSIFNISILFFVVVIVSLVSAQEIENGGGTVLFFTDGSSGEGNIIGGNGSISGKVLPIDSNATVYVIHSNQRNFSLIIAGFATIDNSGKYVITVPMGIYDMIIVPKANYTNRSLFQIGIKENQVTEIQDIILTKIGETGSISGYINPIVNGAVILIKKFGVDEFSGSAIVANDGSYEITDLEPGTYGLFVQFNATQNFYNYKWGMIDIVANISLSGINLTFTPKTSNYLIDRIIVEFNAGVSEEEKRNIIKSYNSALMNHYSYSSIYTVNIPSDKTVEEMVELFQSNSKVKFAYPEYISHTGAKVSVEEEVSLQNFSTLEKEQKSKTSGEAPELKEVESKEAKKPKRENLLLWTTIFVFIPIIIAYLFIKFRRR